ncbi:MAG: hypothetical protein NTV50_14640 [Planctomycetota bacterium]|nr:hypothetical protein [Planctomycetota bacterium]
MAKRRVSNGMIGFFYRSFLFFLILIAALAWLFKGGDFLQGSEGVHERKLRELLGNIEKSNPEAAKRIRDAAKKDPYAVAVAVATLKNQKDYEKQITRFSESLKDDKPNAFIEAIELSVDKNLVYDNEDRKKVIYAHGSFLYLKESELIKKALIEKNLEEQGKYKSEIQALVNEHFDRLKKFSKEPGTWEIVKYDPVAVMVFTEVEDSKLRQFYVENHEWVQDMFSQFQNLPQEKEKEGSSVTIKSVLETASLYYPETKKAVVDQKQNGCGFGPMGFQLFFKYGELIKTCVDKEKVLPLCETLEIFFAQQDYLNSFIEKHATESAACLLARNLGKIKKTSPDLWRAAKASPGALDLYEDAKEFANDVFKKCDGINVQDLLYADYFTPDRVLLKNAAHALAKWGQLAFYTLNLYSDRADKKSNEFQDNNFKKALAKDFRTVFYVFRNGQSGIQNILDNTKYLDKDIDENGELKPEAFSKSIPLIGGPLTVFNNWTKGYPNSYSELGWAALDVADDITTIALFVGAPATGGSSAAAAGAKIAAKTAAKKLAQEAAKIALKNQVKTGFAKFAGSAFSRFIGFLIKFDRNLWNIPSVLLSFAGKTINLALYLARAAVKTWSSLPSGFKSFVYKSFLAITISVSIVFRTIPALWNLLINEIKKLPEELKKILVNAPKDLADAIITALDELFGMSGMGIKVIWWGILVVLFYMGFLFLPKSRLKYA